MCEHFADAVSVMELFYLKENETSERFYKKEKFGGMHY